MAATRAKALHEAFFDSTELRPALHRLEKKGWLLSRWETPKDGNRQFKYYRLTAAGRRLLHLRGSSGQRRGRLVPSEHDR